MRNPSIESKMAAKLECEHLIEFKGVYKDLGGRHILRGTSFEVRKGETFVIIGYSGTGKSVSLRHIVGLMRPDKGSIQICGEEITTMTERELEIMRQKFGVLFQSGALIGWLTLWENVELPLLEHTRMGKAKRAEVIEEKLRLVNLWDDKDKFPAEISGGMKKRAGLARAISMNPEIVLYDEPSSGLDPVIAFDIDKLINNLRDQYDMTQLVVTHDMESAYTIADRIGFFYKGEMRFIGTPDEVRASDIPELQYFITGGRQGRASKKTATAIIRGKPIGLKSVRTQNPGKFPERNDGGADSEMLEPVRRIDSSIALNLVDDSDEPPTLSPEPEDTP